MHKFTTLAVGAVLLLSTSGCYHAVVTTDLAPSDKVVEEKWHLGFVNGLVIPDEIDVADECGNGVAMVETKLSFANQLVTLITGGIFSPMTVIVTCAAGPGMADADAVEGDDAEAALEAAAIQSAATGAPVMVRLAGE